MQVIFRQKLLSLAKERYKCLLCVEIQNTVAKNLKEAASRNNLKHRASKKERYHQIRSDREEHHPLLGAPTTGMLVLHPESELKGGILSSIGSYH